MRYHFELIPKVLMRIPTQPSLKNFSFSRKLSTFITCWVAIAVASCAPTEKSSPSDNWKYTELRLISTYGGVNHNLDLIAAYTREAGSDLQIRLDFLDLTFESDLDLYIALDTKPGGTNQLPIDVLTDVKWETLLVIPSTGSPQALSYYPTNSDSSINSFKKEFSVRKDLIPRVVRIPWQDYIIISINKNAIAKTSIGFNLQAFSTLNEVPSQGDEIGPFSFTASPPSPAPIVLAFWNTFPAYTPAQTLRRWDGAHTGPFGERHGLSILLENIQKSRVPVVLLDLRNPLSLSAIDTLGAIPQILELESNNLVVLPDMLPGSPTFPLFPVGLPDWGSSQYIQDSQRVSKNFGLRSSQIFYSPLNQKQGFHDYKVTFANLNGIISPSKQGNEILPIPDQKPDEQQATHEGLSLSVRKTLLENAINLNLGDTNLPVLILGGSFPESSFGDPQSSNATLSYISDHPWMDPLGYEELLTLPNNISPQLIPGETTVVPIESFTPSDILFTLPVLDISTQNSLYHTAWESAQSLYAPLPPEPVSLPNLRSIYSGQPGIILEAALWAENPKARHDCASDPDQDGTFECILASDQFFTVFDLDGGRLIAAYHLSGNKLHQIIAPTSQFIVGLADPSTWLLDAGEGADPDGTHGAFADGQPPWQLYQATISENNLVLSSPGELIEKRFSLSPSGLHVEYLSRNPLAVQIPLAIDPWNRFSPGWKDLYRGNMIDNGYELIFSDQLHVKILTDAQIYAETFTESPATYNIPEDPNFDYPGGHYVPYPMAIIELQSSGNFTLDLSVMALKE